MRIKKETLIVLALVASLIAWPVPLSAAGNQVVVAPIMERMARAFHGMRSLRASLSQQKTYGQLGMTDPVEQGTLYIKRKSDRDIQVRIEIQQPALRVITVKDNRYTLFQPNINQAIEGQVNKTLGSGNGGANFLAYFVGELSQVTRDYNIVALGDEVIHGRQTSHLRLTPLVARKGLYRQIDLWVDNKLWMPTQQQVVEANQDVTLLQLVDIQVNIDLPDKLFTIKLPRDVQRVRG